MDIRISFKNLKPKDEVKSYAHEKSDKLKKFFDGKIVVNWSFSLDGDEPSAHCHLTGNHMDYFGEAKSEDFLGAVDQVIDKIERQVRKHKEIVKNHHS